MKQVLLNMFPKPTENSWEICFTLKPCLVLISDAESVELRSLGPGKSSHGLRLCINLSSCVHKDPYDHRVTVTLHIIIGHNTTEGSICGTLSAFIREETGIQGQ